MPQILTTIRQKTEREREIATRFREGDAAGAIAMKKEDGSLIIATGSEEKVLQRVADLWRERMEANKADPEFRLAVSAPTNEAAHKLGEAIRVHQRKMGMIGEDVLTVQAIDNRGKPFDLPLAIGDKVRFFDEIMVGDRKAGTQTKH